ncbi:MAG: hypothetical protein R3F60_02960 [bacterium]
MLDCVPAPYAFLGEIARVLATGSRAVLSTVRLVPGATPVEPGWGGHSQRGAGKGRQATVRSLLDGSAGGRRASARGRGRRLPVAVRLHARSTMLYRNHLLALRAGKP